MKERRMEEEEQGRLKEGEGKREEDRKREEGGVLRRNRGRE